MTGMGAEQPPAGQALYVRSPPFVDIQTDPSPDFAVEFEQFRDQHLQLGLKLSRRGGLGDQAVQNASDRPKPHFGQHVPPNPM